MINPIKQRTFAAGKTAKGEEINLTYDVYDYSGLDNEHVFNGTIQGHPESAFTPTPSAPPDAKEYTQANHSPQDFDVTPTPPKGHGPGTE